MSPDTANLLVLGGYCGAAFVASLAGGGLPSIFRLTHTRLQTCISFIAGLMLGMALLHLIPHGIEETKSVDRAVSWALGGFLVMFSLQRVFHYHQHGLPEEAHATCGDAHAHAHAHAPAPLPAGRHSWAGVAAGMAVHSLLDGVALAAAALAGGHSTLGMVGFGTALAVILHKPFDALAVLTLMHTDGCSARLRRTVNVAFALVAPLGAVLALAGWGHHAEAHRAAVGCAVAFCGGGFLCIACSDLLPELHFHTHDRLRLSLALAAGLGVSIGVGWLEHQHHDHHDHYHPHGSTLPGWPERHPSLPTHHPAFLPCGRKGAGPDSLSTVPSPAPTPEGAIVV